VKLALGTVQFGLDYGVNNNLGQIPTDEAKKILNYAKDKGIFTLDTASGYGNSEQVLGEIGVNDYKVITKTSSLEDGEDEVIKNFYQSLDYLKVDQVDGLLIHNINDTKDKKFDNLFSKLIELKKEGLVKKIGFSSYTPEQVDFLLANFDFDLIQLPFNVFDARLISGGQLKELKKKNIEIHARSVFLQGVLLDFDNLPSYFSFWVPQFNQYQEIVKRSGLSLLEYALNFALNTQELDKILVGVNSLSQLSNIVNSSKLDTNLQAFTVDDENLLNPGLWT
jgi:aryl-alcohol dehydrogenase-like predicted oxidoreductase